ncbi:MAG: DUF4091 domain-containing protein [Candidatus Omnitrophota bacterium]|jgi:hypothetical protein|nr:MAG: DUF4091 domain-containing protein [Candidatus Omnitrophota bacterium]
MMIRILLTILIIITTMNGSEANELRNGEFEQVVKTEGSIVPVGWSVPDERGALHQPGRDSKYCVAVRGNGEDDTAWVSDPVPVEPGRYYEFSFWGKAESGARGGSAVSGPTFCNRDIWLAESWQRYGHIFRAPDGQTEARFRLGHWRVNGVLYFDDASLTEVQPIYSSRGGITIGLGERTEGTAYSARHMFAAEGSNSSRFLQTATAEFNSSRWVFSPDSYVVYRHEFAGNRFLSATISISVNHHQNGSCRVSMRADGGEWKEIGSIDGIATRTYHPVEADLPAQAIEVKLEGNSDADGRCGFQINQYEFTAEMQTPLPSLQGDTQYVRIVKTDPRFSVQVLGLGEPKPGITAYAQLAAENRSNQERQLSFHVEIDGVYTKTPETRRVTLAPGEQKTVQIPFLVDSIGDKLFRIRANAHSGAIVYEGHVFYNISYLFADNYGELVKKDGEASVWWCPAMYKVSQSRPAPGRGKGTVHISAAKGEFEPAQVIIRPEQALTNVWVDVEALQGPGQSRIGTENISVKQVEYVEINNPSDGIGCLGFWPDPLPPLETPIDLDAERNYPFWITVRVPRDAAAGIYKGILQLRADQWSCVAPLSVEVFDFAIPEKPSLRSAFGFSPGVVRRYHHLQTDEEYEQVIDAYLQNFRDHRISPYNPTMLHPIQSELKTGEDGKQHFEFNFENFDRAGNRYFDEFGFTSLSLPLIGMGGGTFHSRQKGRIGDFEQGSDEHEQLFHEYASTIEGHLREKGWLDKAFVYWFDEPDPKDYEFVREGMDLIHRNAPGLKRFLTEQPEEELFGSVDIWCPILDQADPELCQPRQEKGEEIWWYVCTGPKQPYPGLFIDHHAVEMRAWIWMTHWYGYQGCLVWQSNYWTSDLAYPRPDTQDPWWDPMSYVTGYGRPVGFKGFWGNGDGRFIYPPRAWADGEKRLCGPVDSFRWEMLREGMEDYEYFQLLKKLVESGELKRSQLKRAEELLAIPESIITSRTAFSTDPEAYYRHRQEIGEFLGRYLRE